MITAPIVYHHSEDLKKLRKKSIGEQASIIAGGVEKTSRSLLKNYKTLGGAILLTAGARKLGKLAAKNLDTPILEKIGTSVAKDIIETRNVGIPTSTLNTLVEGAVGKGVLSDAFSDVILPQLVLAAKS